MGEVAKSYMRKGFLIYEEMRKYFVIYEEAVSHIYDFSTAPFWISLYMRKILFSFLSVCFAQGTGFSQNRFFQSLLQKWNDCGFCLRQQQELLYTNCKDPPVIIMGVTWFLCSIESSLSVLFKKTQSLKRSVSITTVIN